MLRAYVILANKELQQLTSPYEILAAATVLHVDMCHWHGSAYIYDANISKGPTSLVSNLQG